MNNQIILNKNKESNNQSGSRPQISYSNPLDQMRYIAALPYAHNSNILDIACGIGWGSFLLANANPKKVTGVDVSENAILSAKQNYCGEKIEYVRYSGDILPFTDNSFDLIVSFETLEHVIDPNKFLSELHRVAKPESTLILSTPNGYCTKKNKIDKPYNPFHLMEY